MPMQTFIVQPQNQSQIEVVKTLLDAIKVPYEIAFDAAEDHTDETERLKNNPVGAARLNESIEELRRGETVTIKLDDLWK